MTLTCSLIFAIRKRSAIFDWAFFKWCIFHLLDLNGESEIHASSKISSNHTKEGGVEALASDQEKPQQPESNLKENETINKVHALEIAPTLAENPDIKIEEPNSVIKTEDIKIEEPSPVFKTERIKIGEPNSAIKLEDIKIEEPNSVIKPKNAEVEEPKPVIDAIEFSDFVRGKKKFATKFDIHNDRKWVISLEFRNC